jgi:L-arabinose isomerase
VRRWLEQERLTAFTMNFLAIDRASGLPTVPFLEASKAMARGIGYAGEGDVLTAALVGALASVYPETTFTEMFCPDWANDRIFISHMGEMNINLAAEKPRLAEKRYSFIATGHPVVAVGRFRPGEAVLVNLAPGRDDAYTLIIAPVTMLDVDGKPVLWPACPFGRLSLSCGQAQGASSVARHRGTGDEMADTIHGWFRPDLPLVDFLAAYSRLGGTHHSALVYGDVAGEVAGFGEMMDWRVKTLAAVGSDHMCLTEGGDAINRGRVAPVFKLPNAAPGRS